MRTQKMVDRAARDEERRGWLEKDEWCRRFADRIQQRAGGDRRIAEDCAAASWPEAEKEHQKFPQWGQECPESWADEEMSNWEE